MFKKEEEKLLNNIRVKIFTFYNIEPIDSYSAKLTAKDFINNDENKWSQQITVSLYILLLLDMLGCKFVLKYNLF